MISTIIQAVKSRLETQFAPTVYNYYYTQNVANAYNSGEKSKLSSPYVSLSWSNNRTIPRAGDEQILVFTVDINIEIVWRSTQELNSVARITDQQTNLGKLNTVFLPQTNEYTFLNIENTISLELDFSPIEINYLPSRVTSGIVGVARVGYVWR